MVTVYGVVRAIVVDNISPYGSAKREVYELVQNGRKYYTKEVYKHGWLSNNVRWWENCNENTALVAIILTPLTDENSHVLVQVKDRIGIQLTYGDVVHMTVYRRPAMDLCPTLDNTYCYNSIEQVTIIPFHQKIPVDPRRHVSPVDLLLPKMPPFQVTNRRERGRLFSELANLDARYMDMFIDQNGLIHLPQFGGLLHDYRREITKAWMRTRHERLFGLVGLKENPFIGGRRYMTLASMAMTCPWRIPFINDKKYKQVLVQSGLDPSPENELIGAVLRRLWKVQWRDCKYLLSEHDFINTVQQKLSLHEESGLSLERAIALVHADSQVCQVQIGNEVGYSIRWVYDINNSLISCLRTITNENPRRRSPLPHELDQWRKLRVNEEVVERALNRSITCITGAAGTGKTTSTAAIVEAAVLIGHRVLVTSFTAKAVARSREVLTKCIPDICGQVEFATMHSVIANGSCAYTFIIIDESSMVAMHLLEPFLQVVIDTAPQLVFVGDTNQLEPVNGIDIFYSIMQVAFTTRLKKNYRVNSSDIIRLATSIIDPKKDIRSELRLNPSFRSTIQQPVDEWPDLLVGNDLQIDTITHIYNSLVEKYDDPLRVIILAQTNEMVNALNNTIVNQKWKDRRRFEPGMIVMVTQNCNTHGIANGQIGVVTHVEVEENEITNIEVNIDGKSVTAYSAIGPGQLPLSIFRLCYACTVHKSQGSEWDAVIFVANGAPYMIDRKLVYTAITRAKHKLVVLSEDLGTLQTRAKIQTTHMKHRLQEMKLLQ